MPRISALMLAVSLCCAATAQSSNTRSTKAQPERNLVVQAAPAATASARQQRVALVIGNSGYKEAPLLNPVNDARAIAQALQEAGFSVILRENADQRSMLAALREFGDKLRAGGTGLFYYAGHGMQIKGRNFLIPVGANVEREDEVAYGAVDAQAVLDKMEAAGNDANIMILDACRNNPFTRNTRSGQAGLAQMDAPVGTLVAFATSPGAVASDGSGQHGLYTQHLLQAMRQEGSKIEDVFKQVRANVRRDSQGKQVPWEATSLEGDFYFRGGAAAARPASPQADLEQALWDAVKNSNQLVELRVYLNRYPEGRFAEAARGRIGSLQPTAVAAPPAVAAAAPAPALTALGNAMAANSGKVHIKYVVGDRWEQQVEDLLSGKQSTNSFTVESVASNGDAVLNNNGMILSATGGTRYVRQNSLSRERFYDGDFRNIPSQLRVGFREPIQYTIRTKPENGQESSIQAQGHMEVTGRERIDTPAGSFMAWVAQRQMVATLDSGGRFDLNVKSWFVPELKRAVALEFTETSQKTGRLTQHEKQVLKSYRMGDASMQAAIAANQKEAAAQASGAAFALANTDLQAQQAEVDRRTQELLQGLGNNPSRPSGGAAAAISNGFGYTVGDRWRYQTVDKFKGEVVSNYALQIDSIDKDGQIRLNGGTAMWSPSGDVRYSKASDRERTYTNYTQYPAKLEAGLKSSSEYEIANKYPGGKQLTEKSKQSMVVKGQESVRTPAGEFYAWRIEREVFWQINDGSAGRYIQTAWYVPALRRFVAWDEESRNHNGSINYRLRHELTSYSVRGADEALAKR